MKDMILITYNDCDGTETIVCVAKDLEFATAYTKLLAETYPLSYGKDSGEFKLKPIKYVDSDISDNEIKLKYVNVGQKFILNEHECLRVNFDLNNTTLTMSFEGLVCYLDLTDYKLRATSADIEVKLAI